MRSSAKLTAALLVACASCGSEENRGGPSTDAAADAAMTARDAASRGDVAVVPLRDASGRRDAAPGPSLVDASVGDVAVPPAAVDAAAPVHVVAGGYRVQAAMGLPPELTESALTAADCDGDFQVELLAPRLRQMFSFDGAGFSPLGAAWATDAGAVGDGSTGEVMDVDGDGVEDLVLIGHDLEVRAGLGGCQYAAAAVQVGVCPAQPALFSSPADVDLDGLDDIVVSCGSPTAMRVLLARGDGKFQVEDLPGGPQMSGNPFPAFNAYFDDVDRDGVTDVFFLSDTDTGWFGWGDPMGDPAWTGDPVMTDPVSSINTMSVAPIDVDHDGRLEYFLSGSGVGNVVLDMAGRQPTDVSRQVQMHGGPLPDGLFHQAWTARSVDADLDGLEDLLVLRLLGTPEIAGEQAATPLLFVAQPAGGFVDQGASLPAVRSRRAVCGAFRGEGRGDCILAGLDDVTLLVDELGRAGGWAGVVLRGRVSSRLAGGARIAVAGREPTVLAYGLGAGTGGHHAPGIVLATGQAPTITLTIEWPSGIVQEGVSIESGTWQGIAEPAVVTVSRRVAPADGTTRVTIDVDPTLVGAHQAEIVVDATAFPGASASGVDGPVRATLVAPSAPTEVRAAIVLDGRTLSVRPRIRFE